MNIGCRRQLAGCAAALSLFMVTSCAPALGQPAPDGITDAKAYEIAALSQSEQSGTDRVGDAAPALKTGTEHLPFLSGFDTGLFRPEQALTRCQLAQMIYGILEDPPAAEAAFPDVPADAWYAQAVAVMDELGIMPAFENGDFCPESAVTRAECAAALSHFVPQGTASVHFPDVPGDYWAADSIAAVAEAGLFSGDEKGSFNPEAALTRAQAAVAFDKLLGRVPDKAAMDDCAALCYFPDVPTDHWGYPYIMEAVTQHRRADDGFGGEVWADIVSRPTVLDDGFYRIDGWLYRVKDGAFLRSAADGCLTFDDNGRYTTGNRELDGMLNALIEEKTSAAKTRDEKLRILYNYIRDEFKYIKRDLVGKGTVDWEADYALRFLKEGKGNCFSFSAAYCLLCREFGLDAKTVIGAAGRYSPSTHCWVEAVLDGETYMFDPELEWLFRTRYGDDVEDLFKILPSDNPYIYVR